MIPIILFSAAIGAFFTNAFFAWLQYRERKIKKQAALVFLFTVISVSATAQQHVGYLVCFSGQKTSCKKTPYIDTVKELAGMYFPNMQIDFAAVFSATNHMVRIDTNTSTLYVEQKLLVRKANGKLKYKKLNRRNQRKLEAMRAQQKLTAKK